MLVCLFDIGIVLEMVCFVFYILEEVCCCGWW